MRGDELWVADRAVSVPRAYNRNQTAPPHRWIPNNLSTFASRDALMVRPRTRSEKERMVLASLDG